MVQKFEASYFDGTSATAWPVSVELTSENVLIQSLDGSFHFTWPRGGLSITHHARDYATVKNASTHEVLEVHDLGAVAALRPSRPLGLPRLDGRQGFAVLVGVILVSSVLVYMSANRISVALARRVPFEVERKLGEATHPLALFGQECKGARGREALQKLLAGLQTAESFKVQVHIVKSSDVNAYAFLGGQIYLLSPLLDEAQSPAEVAGVLAHEMGHVAERHVLASLLRSTFLTAIWTAAVGDFSGFLVVDPATLKQLAELKYSRDYEDDADRYALEVMRRSNLSPTGLRDFFERLSKADGVLPGALKLLSTHPLSEGRAQAVNSFIEQNPKLSDTTGGLTEAEWTALKGICREGTDAG